jgi:hypothetical protein
MRRFHIAAEHAWPIGDYGSSFRLLRLLHARSSEARVDLAYLAPGDVIARHPAGLPQLFCVITGAGFVSGETGSSIPLPPAKPPSRRQGNSTKPAPNKG